MTEPKTDEQLAEEYVDSYEFRDRNRVWARPSHIDCFLAGRASKDEELRALREALKHISQEPFLECCAEYFDGRPSDYLLHLFDIAREALAKDYSKLP